RRRAVERRCADGTGDPRPAARVLPGADDDPGLAPHHHGQGGRPDLRRRRGPRRRVRGPRDAARPRRHVRRSLPPAVARGGAGSDLMATDLHGEQEFGKAYDARLLARLWTYVHPYRHVFWLALLLSAAQQGCRLVQPYLVKIGIDRYVERRDAAGLRGLGLVYVAMVAGEFATFYAQQHLTTVLAQRSLADLRVGLFARVQRLPMRFFDQNPVGRVVSRLTTDVDVLQEMFAAGAMTIVLDVLGLVGIVAVMLGMDWRLALTSLGLLPVIVGAVDFFRRQVRRTYRMIRERIGRINGYLQEAITGMAVIALAHREVRAFAEFERLNADHRGAYHLSNQLEAALFSFVEAMSTVSIAML